MFRAGVGSEQIRQKCTELEIGHMQVPTPRVWTSIFGPERLGGWGGGCTRGVTAHQARGPAEVEIGPPNRDHNAFTLRTTSCSV